MTSPVRVLLAGVVGYALGTLPSAHAVARLNGVDLGTEGTGNPGAMNVKNLLGRTWGGVVAAGDVGKGVAAARAGAAIAGPAGANVASTAAVAGHCFPPGRPGGKGVATSIGQVIGTYPAYLPLDIAVGYGTTRLPWFRSRTRAATTVASMTPVLACTLAWRRGWKGPGGVRQTVALPLGAVASSVVIAARFAAEAENVDAYNLSLVPDEEAA
ncbi:MAG: glycerol-3-phosphate acyltransferase [Acidimicrobiales bacterium]|nr:glycerol-3-phosphate acyltransferase [Acidimicrobiales bacterium]